MSINKNTTQVKEVLLSQLNQLIEQARKLNLVIEIKLEPNQPLAMGNFNMVPDIREANKSMWRFLSDEEVQQIDDGLRVLRRDGVVLPWLGDTHLLCEKINGGISPIGVITDELCKRKVNPPKVEGAEDVNFVDKPAGS